LYLKTKFFSFKMVESQMLQDHIDSFNKLCLDLENIDIKYDDGDKDKALALLHSLPKSYETFVDILKHGRDKLALDDVIGALNAKEFQHKVEAKKTARDVLAVRFRTEKRDPRHKGRSRSKYRSGQENCFPLP